MLRRRLAVPLMLALFGTAGCIPRIDEERRTMVKPEDRATLDHRSPFLRAHLRDGRVYMLSQWSVDETARRVEGTGLVLSTDRLPGEVKSMSIAIDSVALFETNVIKQSPAVAVLSVVTAVSAAATVACLANPKACFGSCPTFYVGADTTHILAEGFSASIAPSLEALDVDQLRTVPSSGGPFRLRMTNEALETHVVRSVDLWAVPRPAGGRVFKTEANRFYPATAVVAPTSAVGPEGEVVSLLTESDGQERLSLADSTDLSTKESILLEFPTAALGSADTVGLALVARQSLMSTFLLYQTLGFLGRNATAALAALERGDTRAYGTMKEGFGDLLGGITAEVESASGWQPVGQIYETGPLATDTHLLTFSRALVPADRRTVRVRLRFSMGAWRLDQAVLAALQPAVEPIRLRPEHATRAGRDDADALACLLDPARTLVSMPGDVFTLGYTVPTGPHELFIASQGYYLEWMREQWLKEEDSDAAAMVLFEPRRALRELAPAFKRVEPEMEDAFWRSRYVRP